LLARGLLFNDCQAVQDPAHAALDAALLQRPDLVFTAGPTLYEAHRHRHPRVHCLPNAVDASHFAPASLDPDDLQADQAAALQGGLPTPRLGFFGVIDERLDLALVAGVADARPAWQIVMAGPVVGLDPDTLPQRPNIHWLGQQPYARLPHLLAGWDLALMPFALTDATAALSPTMTLEYLAGEKPVVSTPLRDVARLHGHVVRLANGLLDFVAACEETLAETPRQRSRRVMEMLTTVSTLSWDRTAAAMHTLIERALAERHPAQAREHDGVHDTADDTLPALAAAARAAGGLAQPGGRAAQ
jgi:glycosyltransferase involved in cell wall biosynthesis